ncbi:hypothetical protein TNCT_105521 [Trichonephila clavata]|uniref:Uncharacterized protein n=1 Tax=Trichonephila clavata TaxID=2740835 RepID=A0A8X6HZD5_TRICU|nr:hypothetical protein TNCT_105521 [Trichonephila clavata]
MLCFVGYHNCYMAPLDTLLVRIPSGGETEKPHEGLIRLLKPWRAPSRGNHTHCSFSTKCKNCILFIH